MHPNAVRRVPAVLDVIPFPASPGDLAWVRWAKCSESLALHQPDDDSPGRLLGVCKPCDLWVLIELVPDEPEAVMVVLPESGWIRTITGALGATRDVPPGDPDPEPGATTKPDDVGIAGRLPSR